MKRLRCPKCDEPILFNDAQYAPGRTLIFECPGCHKQFRIRIKPANEEAEEPERTAYAQVIVIENAFHLRQEIPLYEGENVVGRHVPGTNANAAFKTVDPSVDTTHCIFSLKLMPDGTPRILLRDAPSNTGTFLRDKILRGREQALVEDGDVITIGATTLILKTEDDE